MGAALTPGTLRCKSVGVLLPLMVAQLLIASRSASASSATDPRRDEAWRIMRQARHAVYTGTDAPLQREWIAAAHRNRNDRRALLGLAELARLHYQYASADSLYRLASAVPPVDSDYIAASSIGMAATRALGSAPDSAIGLFERARAAARAAGDSELVAQALLGLVQLRSRRDGAKIGLQLARAARAALVNPPVDEAAQLECTEGAFADRMGDSTARTRALRGRAAARRAGAINAWAACDILLAQIEERAGAFDRAARDAAESRDLFRKSHDLVGVTQASQWLGYLLAERGYYTEATANLELALRDAQVTQYSRVEAWARFDLAAYVYTPLGDLEAAHAEAARAQVLHARQGDMWGVANDKKLEGLLLASEGRLDEACAQLAAAVVAFRRAGIMFNSVEPLRLLAVANMRAGRLDSAERVLDDATRLAASSAIHGWNDELPLHRARLAFLRGDPLAAESLLHAGRTVDAWRRGDGTDLWTLPTAVLEAQIALRLHRVSTADSAVAFVSSEIARRRTGETKADLRAGLAQLNGDWGVGLSDAYPELVAGLVSAGHVAAAFRFIESVRAREIADAALRSIGRMKDSAAALAGFRRLSAMAPVLDLREARRRLGPDDATVVLTLGLAGAPTTAIVVMSDSAFAISLAGRAELAPLIDRYLHVAPTGIEPIALSRQLGAALLEPIARALPARVTRLRISPDGELYRVPFDALRLSGDRYAVERFAISISPSATVAAVLSALPRTRDGSRVVAVGDPAFHATAGVVQAGSIRGSITRRFGGVTLARLPRSAEEARRVATYAPSSIVLTRGAATKQALESTDLASVAVLHFATHALVDPRGQAGTALALTPSGSDDGFLTTSEIAALPLNGALVVLSACESLGGQILGGEGLRGLSEPFLEAGARAVVVTQWSIGDRSVLPIVDRFYGSMAAGASVGDALRQAKLTAMRAGGRFADWAAFTVIGDASMHPSLRPPRSTRAVVPARP